MVSFVLGMVLFLLALWADSITTPSGQLQQVLYYFKLFDQIHDLARGVVDTRTLIFYTSLTFFFLFLTLRVVESRRWK
jgi:ABC-2 type transport system permease protein